MNFARCIGVFLLLVPLSAQAVPFKEKAYYNAPLQPGDWSATRSLTEIDGKSWTEALVWLADQSQMALHANVPLPEGKARFIAPKGRQFKLLEIFDIINERLQAHEKLMLLRNGKTLMLLSADQEIPTDLIPHVASGDLITRPRTEIVAIVVSQTELDKYERPSARKGGVSQLEQATDIGNGRFLLRADVGTLRHVLRIEP